MVVSGRNTRVIKSRGEKKRVCACERACMCEREREREGGGETERECVAVVDFCLFSVTVLVR